MTIRKGEQWGTRIPTPSLIRRVHNDAELAQCLSSEFISVSGGDIFQTLGAPIPVRSEEECTLLSIDALQVRVVMRDGSEEIFTASSRVEIGSFLSPFRQRKFVCITNGGVVKGRNLAPRAHPNDGRFDYMTVDSSMTLRHRLIARKKAETGTHVPHPMISVRQDETFAAMRSDRGEKLCIDGIGATNWAEVFVTITPDYWQIVV
jgi:hypothetical protein